MAMLRQLTAVTYTRARLRRTMRSMGVLRIIAAVFLSSIYACAQYDWYEPSDTTYACTLEGLRDNQAGLHDTPIDRILSGDQCAIAAAGNSKDPQYVPYLSRLLKSRKEHTGNVIDTPGALPQVALAKLGVERDLFEVQCEIQPKATKSVRLVAIKDKLRYIGGWFAIGLAIDMLRDSDENRVNLSWADQIVSEWNPQTLAIHMLPNLVGSPLNSEPLNEFGLATAGSEKFHGLTQEQVVFGWYQWALAHQDELKKLEPTGESVDYSDGRCEEYLKEQDALAKPTHR
jgi:hypothetical protein